jgi:hypothetical protein
VIIRAYIPLFSILVLSVSLCPGKDLGHFSAGLKFQKTVNLYYENGLELGYTHDLLWKRRIQFGLSYVTSRLGSAMGRNALKQDNYVLSTGLHFRPVKLVDPFVQINLGYFYYDTEIPEFNFLDNHSMIFSFVSGVKFNIDPKLGGVYIDLGYNFITGKEGEGAGTLYPMFFNLGLVFNIYPGLVQ